MFANRPAMKKKMTGVFTDSQLRFANLEQDFYSIRDEVQKVLLSNNNEVVMNAPDLKLLIEKCFDEVITNEKMLLNVNTREQLLKLVVDDILGYGPLEPLLSNEDITEIMVNGYDEIFVERFGLIESTDIKFENDGHLRRVIDRIVSPIGRRIDESSPMVDARLPSGYRVNATIPPLSLDGPILTIRKFAARPYTAQDLIANGTMSVQLSSFLKGCVEARVNMVVSGGTGTGKTTFLNMLSSFIPPRERTRTMLCAWKRDRQILRVKGKSLSGNWWLTPCVCARIVSWLVNAAAAKLWICCKP
jgi:pilus assembly protein CpaF